MSDTISADSKIASGSATAAAAGATIAAVTGLSTSSRYKVRISLEMSGTIDAVNIQNLLLTSGGVTLTTLPSVPNFDAVVIDQITPSSTDLTVKVGAAAFAAGATISAYISATRIG